MTPSDDANAFGSARAAATVTGQAETNGEAELSGPTDPCLLAGAQNAQSL